MRTLGALLLLVMLGGCGGPSTPPPAEPPPSATVKAPSDKTIGPSGSGRSLELTGPPRVPYVAGSVLTFPDGRTLQLPRRWGYTSVVSYADGYLVTDDRFFEGTVGMHRLDASGSVVESWTSTGPARVSGNGRVAWVSLVAPESGRTGPTLLHAGSVDGGSEVTQRVDPTWMPFLTGWFRGRVVYRTWGERSSFLTDLGHPARAVPRAEDLGVLRPDGAYSVRATREGLEVLHADGQLSRVVRTRGLGRTFSADVVWEDDQHLLTTLTRAGRQAVVRIGMGGRISLAMPWRKPDATGFAFLAP